MSVPPRQAKPCWRRIGIASWPTSGGRWRSEGSRVRTSASPKRCAGWISPAPLAGGGNATRQLGAAVCRPEGGSWPRPSGTVITVDTSVALAYFLGRARMHPASFGRSRSDAVVCSCRLLTPIKAADKASDLGRWDFSQLSAVPNVK